MVKTIHETNEKYHIETITLMTFQFFIYSYFISISRYNVQCIIYYLHTVFWRALKTTRAKRPFIISRSTFAGQGHYGGHWSGDNFARYEDMALSIPGKTSCYLLMEARLSSTKSLECKSWQYCIDIECLCMPMFL